MTTNVVTSGPEPRARANTEHAHGLDRFLAPVGRALFTAIFLISSLAQFSSGAIRHAASIGVPYAGLAAPVAGILALGEDSASCSASRRRSARGS
jgi:hypothetical protein